MHFRDAEGASALNFDKTNSPPVAFTDRQVEAGTATAIPSARKRLVFVISHLGPGGAQRVVANAANALVERGFDVHVIIVNENKNVYQLDPRVSLHSCTPQQESSDTRVRFGLLSSSIGVMRRVRSLRCKIKSIDADAVLSFITETNILTVLATRGLRTRTVISERNDPRLQRHRGRVELARWLLYRHADVVTANSRMALSALESFVPKRKLAFLPNPLPLSATTDIVELSAPTIITVGRLVEQKGIDVLLAAWAKATASLPEWRLAVVGDGPLREQLEGLCKDLHVEHTVDWYGHVADPFPLLRAAKFFVLTSRFEGTPNALLEAMTCGLPAVVSDASPGPCELIGMDESAGLIVPVESVEATAEAIVRLARDKTLRHRLARVARERTREHEADQVLETWLQILRCE